MAVTNPPLGLQNVGDTHTAAQLRTYLAGLQSGNFSSATNIRARGGVHPSLGQELVVTQAASPAMSVLVQSGMASISGTEASSQGNYLVCNDAEVTLSVTAAHATLPRIDIVVFNVRDSFYSGGSDDSQLQVIAGTAAGSPVAPSPPENAIIIAQIAVGAAVTTIVNANITDTRFYLAAAGGVMNIRNIGSIPTSAQMAEGQLLWTMDTNRLYVWDGSAVGQIFPAYPLYVVKTADETVNNSATLQNDNHLFVPVEANATYKFEARFIIGSGTTPDLKMRLTCPAGASSTITSLAGTTTATAPAEIAAFDMVSSDRVITTYGNDSSLIMFGLVFISSTAGTAQLQWAQNTANASDTILRANSYMIMTRVA